MGFRGLGFRGLGVWGLGFIRVAVGCWGFGASRFRLEGGGGAGCWGSGVQLLSVAFRGLDATVLQTNLHSRHTCCECLSLRGSNSIMLAFWARASKGFGFRASKIKLGLPWPPFE